MTTGQDNKDPKSLFLQLFAVIALYVGYSNLISLCFSYISLHGKSPTDFDVGLMRFNLASLIIAFLAYSINCFFIQKAQIATRKFFVYLTLFLAGLMVCSYAIDLLYTLLSGALTLDFVLKLLVIVIVTGGISWFYLKEAKQNIAYQHSKIFIVCASIVVLLVLGYGFYLIAAIS